MCLTRWPLITFKNQSAIMYDLNVPMYPRATVGFCFTAMVGGRGAGTSPPPHPPTPPPPPTPPTHTHTEYYRTNRKRLIVKIYMNVWMMWNKVLWKKTTKKTRLINKTISNTTTPGSKKLFYAHVSRGDLFDISILFFVSSNGCFIAFQCLTD